jgi:copper chaperone CopZ
VGVPALCSVWLAVPKTNRQTVCAHCIIKVVTATNPIQGPQAAAINVASAFSSEDVSHVDAAEVKLTGVELAVSTRSPQLQGPLTRSRLRFATTSTALPVDCKPVGSSPPM